MKRFLSVMLVCALPLYAIADFIDKTGYLRYSFVSGSTDKVMVYGTNSSVTRVDIPSTVTYEYTEYDKEDEEYKTKRRTCQVVGIGSTAFRWYYDLVSVEIPGSVKKIEGGAFNGCSSLSDISLNSVETIEDYAFNGCSSLETIDLPSTLTTIGNYAFYNCTSLTRFETPSSLESLGNRVLDGCTALEHATINGDGTLHLGYSMFYCCTSLVSVVLGEGIVSIADGYKGAVGVNIYYIGMFSGCSNLKTVDIRTKKLKKLPDHMFYRSSVETVKFAGGVEYVGYCAFNGCSSLNAIEGEFSPEIVTNSAFSGCASLIGPVDLSRCTYLGNSAFYGCASLSGSACLDKLSTVPSSAFYGCSSLSGVSLNSVETIKDYAFYGCSSLEAIDLPSTLRAMGDDAFRDCKLLQELNIANGVTNIGDNAFYGCTSLTRFETPSSLKSLGNGVLYGCTALEHATINGDGTLHLGTTMFYGCTSLVSVVLGEGVVSITDGYYHSGWTSTTYYGMFSNCSNLKTVDIRTTKLKKLPDYMFCKSSVETVKFAGGVEYVGYYAFNYSSLNAIEGEFRPEIVTNSAFSGCASLVGSVDLSRCTYLGSSAFYGCKSLVGPVDLNKLSTIPSFAFYGCSSLSEISLNSVETIEDNAFYRCSSLETIDLPSTLTTIGNYAFYDCTSLTRFETPSSLKSLGNGVLYRCTALEHATINGDGTLHLGTTTFYGCKSLESVVLGEGIASIADGSSSFGMFLNCSNLKTVDVRTKKLQKLPNYMFYESSVETVRLAGGVEYVGYCAFYYCDSLKSIEGEFRPEIVTNSAFSGCASLIGSVDLSQCTYLGNSAFYGCKSLVGPVNLNKLSTIPSSAFDGCSSLSGVSLNSVETIGGSAFDGCSSLVAIDLPSMLTTIGDSAFRDCKSLQGAKIPNGVTSIGNNAFNGCSGLMDLKTPSSLKTLGKGVFQGCTALEHATINGDGTLHLGTSMFRGCTSLESVVLGEGIASIDDGSSSSGMFSNCNNLKTVDVRTEKLQKLPDYMFYKSSVETVKFAGGVEYVGYSAFGSCSSLNVIEGEFSPEIVTNSAFSGCGSLVGPVDLSRCTYLGSSAFSGCKSLVGPVDLNKLNTIPSRAFYGCSSLSGVSLKGVANIESSAFQECTSLAEISLQGTESVQNQSFYGCSSLLKITNIDSLTNIGGRAFAYCTSLANAFFEWIPPITVASDAFYNINTNCYGFYLDKYETEWDAVIDENGKWHGLIMRHMENDQCCKVRFDPNGGNISAADATKTVIKNSTIGKLPTATMDGHMLEGWYTLPTGGVRVTESTLVVDDMTCYANWFQSTNTVPPEEDEKWSYTVRFHPNGDKEPFYPVIGTVPDQQFYFDEEKALNLNCYSRTGFKFGGWVKNPDKKYVNDYPDGKVVKNIAQKDGDVVDLYALWIPNTVKITFDYNFSLNDFDIIERYYTVGRKFGRLPFFAGSTRAKWLGWFTDPVGGAEVDMAETWVPTSPTTYYGHWWIYDRPLPEPPPVEEPPEGYYIVLFDANGGSINPVDQAIIVASGEPIGEFPAVTRDGYDFDGWYTAANGGMRIAESTLVTANMTCYAHWRELPVAPVPDPGYGYIRNVTAKQRYPWNGKVDIRFEVVGDVTAIKPGAAPVLVVSATNTVSGETWDAESLTGDTGTEEGWHEILWDLDAQGLDIYSSDIVITVGYRGNVQTNGSSSGKYCVIDLSGGANATNYPVSYLDSEPTGGWTDEYKTAKLVLRRIDPGTFMMGDISASKAVEVALTKPFYMGVFEVTQKQYGLVTGQNPSSIKGNGMPVDRVSWQAIRGNNNWPDVKTVTASSFVGLIQTKTGLKFDLPTEAQWEYACRAGTATSYYWGDSMDGDYAWYWDNSTNLIHEAGTKRPNAWGLYDMIGNVNEWCLDWYQDKLPGGENPEGYTSGRGRAVRGGNGTNFAYTCTSSYRSFSSPMPALGYYGFRLSRTLSDAEIADASTIPGGAQEEGESSGLLCTGASPRTPIDMRDEPEVESARIVHDSRWIGGNPGAAVLVTDNDEEVRWVAGKGEFTWVPATAGRHVLKYLTYIDGVLQEEIYTAIFRCDNLPEDPIVDPVSSRVTSVSVKPRWPWNGLVDIDYTLAVEPTEGRTAISVSGYDTVTKTVLAPVTLSGVGADGEPVPSGTHRITWDVGADYPEFHSEAFTVDVSTGTPGVSTEIANVSTAAGTNCVSANGQYMVIDLSGGTNAVSYPVSWLDAVPAGGWTDEHKTEKLVLRRIEPGVFAMGDASCSNVVEVTLTKPFYIGVFEVTQRQYELVKGENPSFYAGSDRPVDSVSWDMIRGDSGIYDWPTERTVDPSSFMGIIRQKTGLDIDLPTEAQWEYACRAGTASAFNNGSDLEDDLRLLGRYWGNRTDGAGGYSTHTAVGSYAPNAWGLFDMHGNENEWCLDYSDWFTGGIDPEGATDGLYRVLRGGCWQYEAVDCRSSSGLGGNPSNNDGGGFRIRCSVEAQAGWMTSNSVRVDVRSGIGRYIASGVELLGRPDGAYVSEWDTRGETDGWRPVVSDDAQSPSVCILNTTAIVHGGRIGSDETWRSDHVHVVRSNVVVPDGVRLVLDMDAIVKFAPGAKISTEGTGVLLVNGARCADIADDSVGGDTNMDMDGADGGLSPSTTVADWFEGNVRPFSVRFGSIGDVIEDCVLKRFYTSGIPLGTLPEPKVPGNKVFDCWCVEDSATPVDGNYEVVSSMVLLPRYSASYYWLEISATEGGSTSRSSGLVEAETRIVVIAEPAFGYRFVRWEGDVSESQAYSSQVAVLMDRTRSLRAVFERIPITIGEAVNAPQLSWYTEGDAEWFGEWSQMASDGEHAARSGGIGDSKETVLGLRVSGTGVLSFDWKSSCEERYDAVRLEIDGTQTRVLSGESSWASVRIELGFGDHDIRWVYKKGRSNSSGEDAVWVDNVAWTAAATPTLREALGDFDWETEGEIQWRAMRSEYAYEGDSFAIAEGLGDYGASVIRTTVSGAGRIVFRWAVSCEEGYDWFDFLADGEVVEMTTGETGWKTVSVDLGEGEHELEWVYWKDEIDDLELVGANCAMLDYVQWFPEGKEPPTIGGETLDAFFEWLKSNKQIGAAATRQEAMDLFFAGTAAAGKNVALYDEFLAGTDPKDPASGFKAIIDIKDGKPVVSPSPDLGDARRYTIYGKKDIGDTSEAWIRVEEGGESQFRFFKVTVDMP